MIFKARGKLELLHNEDGAYQHQTIIMYNVFGKLLYVALDDEGVLSKRRPFRHRQSIISCSVCGVNRALKIDPRGVGGVVSYAIYRV